MMVARRERRGALVCGATARAKKKRVSDSGDCGVWTHPPRASSALLASLSARKRRRHSGMKYSEHHDSLIRVKK